MKSKFKTRFICLLAVLLMTCLILGSVQISAASQDSGHQSKQRVIVLYDNALNKLLNKSQLLKLTGTIDTDYKNVPAVVVSATQDEIDELKDTPHVIAVENDIIVSIEKQSVDWGIDATDAASAWNLDYTGKGVKIAVLDTGIATHPDLTVAGGVSFLAYTNGSYEDDHGHGTHVAGIIGADNNDIGVVGIAPDASIYAIKALDNSGDGYLSDIIKGIDWAISNDMDIINLSLGADSSMMIFEDAVNRAYQADVLVVAAAGNDGTASGSGDTVDYPARYDSVIAVAAIDEQNNRAEFSSTGSSVEVTAPGVNIKSTYLNGSYVIMSGTSMATPYVSGDIALLMEANPSLNAVQIRQMLRENVIDLGASGKDNLYGCGLIQAYVSTSPSVAVTFNSLGGSDVRTKLTEINSTITAPANPTRAGYEFGGWYKEKECKNTWNFNGDIVTANTILYAKWIMNQYTLVFDSQGGSYVESVTANYDTTITQPANPTKSGYLFSGWYKEASCVNIWNFSTNTLQRDTTLYAKWIKYPSKVNNVKAAAAGYTSIKINWSKVTNATGYRLYRATSYRGSYKYIGKTSSTSYKNTPLTTGKKYYYKVRAYTTVGSTTKYGSYSSIVSSIPVPSTPSVTVKSSSYKSIKISWKKVSGASGYRVYRATSKSGKYKLIKTTTSTRYTNSSLRTGKRYYYKVRPYKWMNSKRIYGNYSSIKSAKPIPSTPSVTVKSNSYKSIKISWKKVSGASGYRVYRATSKSGKYKLIKTTTSTRYTNSSLRTGKRYYYKVRAYKYVSGKRVYGKYSSIKSAKPVPSRPSSFSVRRYSSSKIKISYGRVSGASGYRIYRATSRSGTYKLVKTTTSRSWINTGRTKGKTYYYKVRAYKWVSGKRVYGPYTTIRYTKT
jgi:uncharacterized repeat protein (TIGR02543 family)